MREACRGSQTNQCGIDIAVLENDLLRVQILAGKGADVYELRYKPFDADVLLKMPDGLRCFEGRDLARQRLTWYSELTAGGWQDVLPHRALYIREPGAEPLRIEQSAAGAAATLPWQTRLESLAAEVALVCSLRVPDSPLYVEKRFCLRQGEPTLVIDERVRNVSESRFDFTWTQHPAFGSDLLHGDVALSVPACTVFDPVRYSRQPQEGVAACEHPFDAVVLSDGAITSLARVELRSAPANSNRFFVLRGMDQGRALLFNRTRGLGVKLEWDLSLFPFIRYWYRNDARYFALGIEPSNDSFSSLEDSLRNGTFTRLEPGAEIATTFRCGIVLSEQA